ncbi:hypothetical protein NHX12_025985 [Muraenolepis orangiensis]|uniref:SAM domain-containing protein n=1 Tax=Muraenolepis orangiensis TaxID=630683 RepID=A0A9Q0EGM2_9TELE|nr:hypothetical protein NHX12_025985 [Muraenolepis orangiensis]
MGLSRRVSVWSVEEVSEWVRQQYPGRQSRLQTAILQHAVSGRVLLRMRAHHLEHLGVEAPAQQEILQDVLHLRVREELENLMEIFTGLTVNGLSLAIGIQNRGSEASSKPDPEWNSSWSHHFFQSLPKVAPCLALRSSKSSLMTSGRMWATHSGRSALRSGPMPL